MPSVAIAIQLSRARFTCDYAHSKHTWLNFNMADDNIEEGETNELSSLALDSNKQKEFEDKVKRIRAQVSTTLCSIRNSLVYITTITALTFQKIFNTKEKSI